MPDGPFQPDDQRHGAELDPRLRAAYRVTRYRFEASGGELQLQVDCCNEGLQKLLRRSGLSCAAVLTAFNPGSMLQDAGRNLRAQTALVKEVQELGLECIPGRHEDPGGRWPDEAGILVLGLGRDIARQIAARYGQLALLWSDLSATPRLVETTTGAGFPPRP